MIGIRVVEQDGPTVWAEIDLRKSRLTVIADMRLEPDRLVLYNLHIDGPGSGRIGTSGLREIVRSLMETYDVSTLEIHGFRRTTGAGPGRVPRPLRFTGR